MWMGLGGISNKFIYDTYSEKIYAAKLIEEVEKKHEVYRGNHLMVLFGSDFAY